MYLEIISIVSLMLAIVCVWIRPTHLWTLPFILFLVTGLISDWLTPIALVSILILASVVRYHLTASTSRSKALALLLLVFTTLVFAAHLPPGFETLELFPDAQLSQYTAWSALRFTADKPLVGLFLLLAYRESLCSTLIQLRDAFASVIAPTLIGILSVYLFGLWIGYVAIDMTASVLIVAWFFRNLLFTVVAEEVFFRCVVHNRIESSIQGAYAPWYALCLTALLFGVVHLYAGWQYGLLAALSGLVYGYAYLKTRRVEMAIMAHIFLNLGHITFLSYPTLRGL